MKWFALQEPEKARGTEGRAAQQGGDINKGEDSAATRRTGSEASTSMSTSACTLLLVSRALSLRFCAHFALHAEARQASEPTSAVFSSPSVRGF